jgi:hypothetical protein
VFNRASVSPRFGFRFAIGFRSVVVCVAGFRPGPRPSPARPSPARPGPWRPTPPCVPPSLSHLVFPRSNSLSLSSTSLSHLFALGDPVDGYRRFLDPKVSSPLLSLPLPPLCPSLRVSLAPRARVPARVPSPGSAPPWPPACGPWPLARGLLALDGAAPWPPAAWPPGPSRRGSLAPQRRGLPAPPPHCAASLAPAHGSRPRRAAPARGGVAPLSLTAARPLAPCPVRSRARSPSVHDV